MQASQPFHCEHLYMLSKCVNNVNRQLFKGIIHTTARPRVFPKPFFPLRKVAVRFTLAPQIFTSKI